MDTQSNRMPLDAGGEAPAETVSTFRISDQTRVVALRGAVRHEAEADLREALVGAIENGARVILLDLTSVESIVPSADELIVAAGAMLSDRGGVLLTWREDRDKTDLTYVIGEMSGRIA